MEKEHRIESHTDTINSYRRLKIAFVITFSFMVAEALGGILSDSLSLLGDAGHMLVDAFALALSLFAMNIAHRPATAQRTFGYRRIEILAALTNGTILIVVAGFIFFEAYQRFFNPPEIKPPLMLLVATAGLAANITGMILLGRASHGSLNIKAALWHVTGDTISSVGVIIAGIIILFTGWYVADTIAALVIGSIILGGAVRIVSESTDILLESVPRHIETARVIEAIKSIPGVNEVHDVHIWTITSNIYALSAHLMIDDQMVSRSVAILSQVREELARRFSISHTTLQLECETCPSGTACEIEPPHDLPDELMKRG
ncbi:MAG: cation diffusion facilitator family transporter [Chloroflexota bacterium]